MTQKLQNNYSKRNSLTVKKVLGPTTDFPTWGSGQRDWEPPGNLTLEASGIWLQNFHSSGETDSWRAQTKPRVHQEPGERNSVPIRDWARLACECPGVSGRSMGQQWPAVESGALNTIVHAQILLKEVAIGGCHCHLHYPYHNLASGQTTGRELSPTHQHKMGNSSYLKSHLLCL